MQDTFCHRTQTKFKWYLLKTQMKNESRNRSCSGCKVAAEGMLCSEQGEERYPGSRQGMWEQHWGRWSTPSSKQGCWRRQGSSGVEIAAATTHLCSGCFHH